MAKCETTEVIICGGGPTGALLSALLGRMNVPNVVLERDAEISTDPRGIALDEDGIRLIQAIGMYNRVYTRIGQCQETRFISGTGSDLMKPPIFGFKLSTSDGGTGHVGLIFHKQPELERAIRDAILESPCSEMRTECTLVSIAEDTTGMQVEYTDHEDQRKLLRASFLVGADGKTGFVRKRYLEPRGITLDRSPGTNYDETWVALNWHIALPTPESHPGFPLWKLDYSPEQVYDLFFPQDFRFLCNPNRPAVCGRFGLPKDRLWRFEFVVQSGEDPNEMASVQETTKIIYPYITHPGSRYGLDSPVRYPEDCISTLRSRPFNFSARSCNKWALGRVAIVGDAAHVFPPFGGQGIASGFRDASSLAWRLAFLCRDPEVDHGPMLWAWYTERKQQLESSLAATVRNGALVTNASPWQAWMRDWSLWLLQLSPQMKRYLEKGPRVHGMTRYHPAPGLPFVKKFGGGLNIPQVYARDLVSGKLAFSDDFIFVPYRKSLFQLLILADSAEQVPSALVQIQGLSKRTAGRLREDEATVLIQDLNPEMGEQHCHGVTVVRIASGEEFAADPELCRRRPAPKCYDPFRIRKDLGQHVRYVVLRADRFVYSACASRDELWESLNQFEGLLWIHHRAKL